MINYWQVSALANFEPQSSKSDRIESLMVDVGVRIPHWR